MKIAIIAPGTLPIPNVKGGAIETLTTYLLDENEIHQNLDIDVFSEYDASAVDCAKEFKKSNIIFISSDTPKSVLYNRLQYIKKVVTLRFLVSRTFFMKCVIVKLKQKKYDVIVIEGSYIQILELPRNMRENVILHMHTDCLLPSSYKAHKAFHAYKKVFAISEYLKNSIARIDMSQKNKISVFKNAIDIENYGKASFSLFREQFRLKHSITSDDVLVIFCGRIDESKGVRELLLAVKQVPECKLLIVGSSWFSNNDRTDYMKDLEQIAADMENRVIFTGYIPHKDVPLYYYSADIAAFPSRCNEAAGLVIIEAMASGLPVITTKQGGIPEYANTASCILVDADENIENNLEKALQSLVKYPEKMEKMRANAKENAKEFNTKRYYSDFKRLIGDSAKIEE